MKNLETHFKGLMSFAETLKNIEIA